MLMLPDARHDSGVVGVERLESVEDSLDDVGCQRRDPVAAAGGGAWNRRRVGRADDGHGVGVAEGVDASGVGDGSFEHGEHESGGGGDGGGDRGEAVGPGVLGGGGCGVRTARRVHRR